MDNARAIALMTLSMASFAIGDATVKLATQHLSIAQVLIFMSIPGVAVFAALAHRSGQNIMAPAFFARPVVLRNTVEAATAMCMVTALAIAPLSMVISITQAVPLLVTLGAALILRETVGARRWSAIAIGLLGVLLMLRPDTSGLTTGALLALGAAVGLAVRDLITRVTPPSIGTLQMSTWGLGSLIVAGVILLPFTGPHPTPTPSDWAIVLAASAANTLGYYAITAAMRLGDVSLVTPFRYSRLVFALIIAMALFGERPDAMTLLGASIVIASGLFVMWRERVARQKTSA